MSLRVMPTNQVKARVKPTPPPPTPKPQVVPHIKYTLNNIASLYIVIFQFTIYLRFDVGGCEN